MISRRIRTIASLIDPRENVLDVGTDHAFLPVVLKKSGHQGLIRASELRKGPRLNAIRNLQESGIDDVEVYLTYGVNGIDFPADVVVIAGMGYATVTGIISENREYFHDRRIIIQINNEVDKLRRWLMDNGFAIENEVMIRDYKYYEILVVREGKMTLDEMEIRFGPHLLREKSETFRSCYLQRIEKLENIIKTLPADHKDIGKLEQQIEIIKKALADESGPHLVHW